VPGFIPGKQQLMKLSDETLSKPMFHSVFYTMAPDSKVIWNLQLGFMVDDGMMVKSPPDSCVGI